ncbi:transposase [Neisseria gonorrhoeae]|nr:hypothetical protein NGFG_02276 [Neisseria gonorrhoeae MS11]SPY15516.1 transposase [Neisseria gonorrhoeae]STZ84854.1 transposase [Neisseria gonorrhoeae]
MPPNRIGKNRLDMSGGIRMPVCMKSPNILIVRQPPFAMRPNRCGWRAKKTAAYKGQDPAKVTHYLTRPAGFSDCQRVCPDETGFDRRLFRPYARSLKGQMAKARISGKRYRRLSLVSAQVGNRPIAPVVCQNTVAGVFFEARFQQCLLPALAQKSVIISDNARFRRMGALRGTAEKLGHKVLPPAPCSPEPNPIEKVWANIKRYLRTVLSDYARFDDALLSYFDFN